MLMTRLAPEVDDISAHCTCPSWDGTCKHAVAALLVLAGSLAAQDTFPGLATILSDAEKKRAGLDRLSPDEVGVIDADLGLANGDPRAAALLAAFDPSPDMAALHAAVVAEMKNPEMHDYLTRRLIPVTLNASPAEFDAYVRSESQRWMKIIKDNNVKID